MEQKLLILYPLGFDNNKVFKEKLCILTYVQVYKNISFRIDEEMLEKYESESEDQTLALKTTPEDSASDRDPNFEEVKSEESHPLVTRTLKCQKPKKKTMM